MLAATRAEAIAETEKVLLVDALQNPQHRLLDDLVLQRSDARDVAFPLSVQGRHAKGLISELNSWPA